MDWRVKRPSEVGYYFFSVFGVAATQAPFLSAPPFGSHFIFAFTHSAFVLGVDCAKAVGESASAPTMATAIRNFIAVSFRLAPRRRWNVSTKVECLSRPPPGAAAERVHIATTPLAGGS